MSSAIEALATSNLCRRKIAMTTPKDTTALPRSPKDLSGQLFGSLVVQRYLGRSRWECLCACGRTTIVKTGSLPNGHTRSCGCKIGIKHRGNPTHGLSRLPAYKRWAIMISRCYSPGDISFPRYGGRGITVCERWRHSVENFYADMGDPPPETSLERIDNDAPYSPENCCWALRGQQARNRRSNHVLTYNDETHTIIEWAESMQLRPSCLYQRIRAGWSIERALTTPSRIIKRESGAK